MSSSSENQLQAEATSVCTAALAGDALRKHHVLVVDDEKIVRISLSVTLNGPLYAVETADDGDTALEKIRLKPGYYALVVTDHNMQRINGIELVEHLKQAGFAGKIVVLTGYMSRQDEEIYRAIGVDKIIYKPCDPVELRNTVRELTT